jgi:hypothetical protein
MRNGLCRRTAGTLLPPHRLGGAHKRGTPYSSRRALLREAQASRCAPPEHPSDATPSNLDHTAAWERSVIKEVVVLSPHHPDVRRGTRCSRSGSCRGVAPLSGAFRRCSPADSPVGALAHRCAPAPRHPLQLQRVETPSQPRRLGCAAFRSVRVPCGTTQPF